MSTVLYRGTLTIDKLKELTAQHLHFMDENYNPAHNHDAISIIKQPDGNWIGTAWKNNTVVSARQSDPTIVLTMLLTHE